MGVEQLSTAPDGNANHGDVLEPTEVGNKYVVHTVQGRVAYTHIAPDRVIVKDLSRPGSEPVEMVNIGEG